MFLEKSTLNQKLPTIEIERLAVKKGFTIKPWVYHRLHGNEPYILNLLKVEYHHTTLGLKKKDLPNGNNCLQKTRCKTKTKTTNAGELDVLPGQKTVTPTQILLGSNP